MAPKPREGTDSHCAGCSWPSISAVHAPACYGGMTVRHNDDSIWLDRAVATTDDDRTAIRAPVTKATHGGLGDDVLVAEMFAKELTPSDVGKLNRLVIPKKHAMQHFSQAAPTEEELSIRLVDKDRRWWTFRYCYWKSSQSFVFTKGWNRFVKEKRLRAKDTVAFYRCNERRNGLRRTYCLIDTIQLQTENDRNEDDKTPKDGLSWSASEGKGLELSFERRMKQQREDDQVEFTRNIMKTKYGDDGESVPMVESKKKLKKMWNPHISGPSSLPLRVEGGKSGIQDG